ncbi:MAG TPA: hypothetical protein VF221_02420 [Chloroflexota bacterium]
MTEDRDDALKTAAGGQGAPQLEFETAIEQEDTAMEDVHGPPLWPVIPPDTEAPPTAPPVGLSWSRVAEQTGIEVRILEHDGSIVLAGEYVPAPGFVIDPTTFLARSAKTGDRVLHHSYFVGELTAAEFGLQLRLDPDPGSVPNAVVRSARAPVIGLFPDAQDAQRAKRQIVEGSIGYGVSIQQDALGTELRVSRADAAGRVASVIATHHGAVISVGGEALR